MNGNDIGGAGTVSGTTGDFTNLKATGLTLGGNTGKTSAQAYDAWVMNATTALTATNALRLGGRTLNEVIDSLPASGPSGIPSITAINGRTSGNTTLAVIKNKWYKVDVRSGTGEAYYQAAIDGGENSSGSPETQGTPGKGVSTLVNIQAKNTGNWTIKFHVSTGSSYKGGTAIEILEGTTTIIILGGGGAAGHHGSLKGGDAGLPTAAGGAVAGKAAGNSAGGAASNGDRVDTTGGKYGGSGYSAGKSSTSGSITTGLYHGGGGSSYINADYNMLFEQTPALGWSSAKITIWEYK